MEMNTLDHVTISTNDLEATRKFYCDVLGLEVGFRPPSIADRVKGIWLYPADGKPRVHVIAFEEDVGEGSAAFNHFAFTARGGDGFKAHLEKLGVAYREANLPDIELYQIFFHDPQGIEIEVTFEGVERPREVIEAGDKVTVAA